MLKKGGRMWEWTALGRGIGVGSRGKVGVEGRGNGGGWGFWDLPGVPFTWVLWARH